MRWWNRQGHDGHEDGPEHPAGPSETDVRKAYERGRRDERARRRSHPILALVIAVAAVAGVGFTYLAAREGSFARGGQLVDHRLASAAGDAHLAAQSAGDRVQGLAPTANR